ncbi:branched-chain amino acid ABC transporter permease [Effusibacillus pohliae]|uniref:branched-chain amino acid ABC transporter permease n=1 Tax=Effusibacillus pohliae TaxID=232270 RepID=UPI0003766E52|nr:branched-chain amino acid ABC transporter permease [Effusibacillus pohliae]
MEALSQILQLLFSGLTIGSIYALIAVGFVITYNITGVLNFAQGEFAMLGALISISLADAGVVLPVAVLLSVAGVVAIGGLFERLAIYPARRSPLTTLIIITIGVSIALRGLALFIWGTEPHSLRPFSGLPSLHWMGAVLLPQSVWAVAVSCLMIVTLYLFFERTYLGKAVTACVVNRFAARLMGIRPEKMSLVAITVSAGLGAIAGIIIAPISGASYNMGLMLGMKAFVAAVIGGLTNAPAAILGGFLIGIVESFTEGLWTTGFKDAISFGILLLVLFVLPNGIFAKATGKRV